MSPHLPPLLRLRGLPLMVSCVLLWLASAALALQEPSPAAPSSTDSIASSDSSFEQDALPVLTKYCFRCHGPRRQQGSVRLDEANPDMLHGPDRDLWIRALKMVEAGEMPPRRSRQPSEEERDALLGWMKSELKVARDAHKGTRRTVLRRLTRAQYTRSLQELLGMSVSFGSRLPADGKSHMGFTNNGEVLRSSPLHLEYYQSIARDALDKAIAWSERPASTHYRVTFGKGVGEGHPGARTGGYQSVPLSPSDFAVDILDQSGQPKTGLDEAEQAELDRVKKKITVGFRGSSQDRFHTVDEGIVLYSALPHKEVAPGAWQGPSPNMKLEMQRVFPEEGDFVMRVEASRGYLVSGRKELLVSLESPQPIVSLQPRSVETLAIDERALQPTELGPWYLAGPIHTDNGDTARDTQFTVRKDIDYTAPLNEEVATWSLAGETDGKIQKYETKVGAVLLARTIEAPSARTMDISVGSDDAMWIWLNGEPVLEADVRRGVAKDQNRASLPLLEGENQLVMKIVNYGGGFGSYHQVLYDGTRSGFTPYEVITPEDSHVVLAERSTGRKNLEFQKGSLIPLEVPEDSEARLSVDIPAGYWRFDLVHPALPPDAMGSIRLRMGELTLDCRPELTPEQVEQGYAVTPIGGGYLNDGEHELVLGGPFFVGFSHLILTPLDESHPLVARLESQAEEEDSQLVPALRAYIGTRTDDGMDYATFDHPVEVDVPLGDSRVFEFRGRLENLPIPEPESGDDEILSGICVLGIWNDHLVKSRKEPGAPLLIKSVEFEAPFYDQWPPESHQHIFHDSPNREDKEAYTREVLASFLPRAFRRPVGDDEIERYMNYWRSGAEDYDTYEKSVREVLVAALCSPSFLFMAEPLDRVGDSGQIDDATLASRLSYFLWNSPPDSRLLQLAEQGSLRDVLDDEVSRLLDDPRIENFVRGFTYEWLRLDRLDGMTINPNRFPAFTRFVKRDMEEETYAFFSHVLRENLSAFALVDSDFAMLNQNLAEFYGIEGVQGVAFRPVAVRAEQNRGGLISQGAFLVGHSDGNEPHPIKRAVWVKEKILGQPPLPPPPNVPDLDPTTPGFEKLTLKEQLEQHRDNPSCRDCHASFDPYGIALESYNAVGLLEAIRKGRPVDASTILPDGTAVDGPAELKTYILEQVPDQFIASLVEHLYAYALGRDTDFADEEELEAILENVRESGYSMRSVIRGIVASPSFRDL